MTGTWGHWTVINGQGNITAYSKDGNFWWVAEFDLALVPTLFTTPEPGRYWNEHFWTTNFSAASSWAAVGVPFTPVKGPFGPIPQPFNLTRTV